VGGGSEHLLFRVRKSIRTGKVQANIRPTSLSVTQSPKAKHMSQSYRVNFPVKAAVCQDDEAKISVDVQNILPKGDMEALLRGQIESKGYERQADGSYKKTSTNEEGVTVDVSINKELTEVSVKANATIEVNEEIEARGYDDVRGSIERSRKEQEQALLDRKNKELASKVSKAIEGEAATTTREVQDMLQGVYGEALKQKAKNMGEVMEQHEGSNERGDYELVIKVKV
jgi:hypothetical protein